MKKSWGIAAGILILAAVFCWLIQREQNAPSASTPAQDPTPTRPMPDIQPAPEETRVEETPMNEPVIEGTVVSSLGELIMDTVQLRAFIEETDNNPGIERSFSAVEGRFSVMLPPNERAYDFDVLSTDYLFSRCQIPGFERDRSLQVSGEGVSGVILTLMRSASISGQVVNMLGQPVPNFYVLTMPDEIERKPTDERGQFSIGRLEPCRIYLWGYLDAPTAPTGRMVVGATDPLLTVELEPGERKNNLKVIAPLDPGRIIEGRVVDEDGKPIPNVDTWVEERIFSRVAGFATQKTTSTGQFRIESILPTSSLYVDMQREDDKQDDPQEVNVCAAFEGYEPGKLEKILVGAKDAEVVLLGLRRGSIALATIEEKTRKPIANAEVYWVKSDVSWGEERCNDKVETQIKKRECARQDTFGTYWLEDLPEGQTRILVYADGYGAVEKLVPVSSSATTEVKLPLEPIGLLCFSMCLPQDAIDGWTLIGKVDRVMVPNDPESDEWVPRFRNRILKQPIPTALQCGNPDDWDPFHKDFYLPPGQYQAEIFLIMHKDDPNGPNHDSTWGRRTFQVRVESGKISRLDIDMSDMSQVGAVEVELLAPPGKGCSLLLMTGEYSGFLEFDDKKSRLARMQYEELYFVDQPSQTQIFPLVPPGQYSLVYKEERGGETLSKPSVQHVKVTAGETQRIVIP